jgi:hypothetical protein
LAGADLDARERDHHPGPAEFLLVLWRQFQTDPHWRDHMQFFEYFHGDNGAGLGASHQTGWTGLVAKFIQLYGILDAKRALEGGKISGLARQHKDLRLLRQPQMDWHH